MDAQLKSRLNEFVKLVKAQADDPRRLVIMIATGGTLAMREGEDGVRIPDMAPDKLLEHVEGRVGHDFNVISFELFNMDSAQMSYAHVRTIAQSLSFLWAELGDDPNLSLNGFLVTHGTDTLSYSSSGLSLMMGQGLPFNVVYTAAQKPINHPMSDAPRNICNALHMLQSLYDHNMAEVVVCVGDFAMLATSSAKVHDLERNAFAAPLHDYIARFDTMEHPIMLANWLKSKRVNIPFEPVIWDHDYSQCLVIRSALGLSPDMIARQVSDANVKGVIFYSYAAGTVDEAITDAILGKAKDKNIPVFVVSPVNSRYRVAYQSGQHLIEQGVQPLLMTLSAAMAKFEVALIHHPNDIEAQKAFMAENYVGEVPRGFSR